MAETNGFGLPRNIPAAIKRAVRQRDGFGCVVCGSAIIDYEHFDPEFKDAQEHTVDGIILLCPNHHRAKGSFISRQTIANAIKSPACRKNGFARGPFDVGNDFPEIVLGTFIGRNVPVLIRALGEDVFSILPPEEPGGPFRLSALLRDSEGQITFKIVENEWQIPDDAWDAVVDNKRITIRRNSGEIALVLRPEPPGKIVIEHLEMAYKEFKISCREGKHLTVSTRENKMVAHSMSADGCRIGIEITQDGLSVGVGGGAVYIGSMEINSGGLRVPPRLQVPPPIKMRRNQLCWCKSGSRFKHCHGRLI